MRHPVVSRSVLFAVAMAVALPASGRAQAKRSQTPTVLLRIGRRAGHDRQMRDSLRHMLRRAGALIAMADSLPAAAPYREVAREASPDVKEARGVYNKAAAEATKGHYARAVDYAQRSIELASRALERVLVHHAPDVTDLRQVSGGEAPPSTTVAVAGITPTVAVAGIAPTIDVRAATSTILAGPNVRVVRSLAAPPQYREPFGVVPVRDSLPFGVVPAGPGIREPYITQPPPQSP